MSRTSLDARPGETIAALSPLMGYLLLFEWAGVSDDGRRAWASTEGKQELGIAASPTHG